MAPMIETPFAMKKFKDAFEKVYNDVDSVERIINAETITCLDNYDAILECGNNFLTGVTVGRSDLSASMGIEKKDIECNEVFEATKRLLIMSRNAGLAYSINQEEYLKVFLTDGEVPIDDSASEWALRNFTIGRKNWMTINTVRGAQTSAVIYSITETVRAGATHALVKEFTS